jgi:elongator complex protein 3
MEEMLLLIIGELREHESRKSKLQEGEKDDQPSPLPPDEVLYSRLIDRLGKGRPDAQDYSKEKLLPYYQEVKRDDPVRWRSWNVDPALEKRFLRVMQVKPRRTASGVATITVITKPWKCSSDCLYCPNDLRMPKSYLSDEPACQRAERNFFDPYLQVQARLRALIRMGHLTDKIEVIVLGGSWCDYPRDYQLWFTTELYRALNAGAEGWQEAEHIRQNYLDAGMTNEKEELVQRSKEFQEQVNAGKLNYNQAIEQLRKQDRHWQLIAAMPDEKRRVNSACADAKTQEAMSVDATASIAVGDDRYNSGGKLTVMDALRQEQDKNEAAVHRMVGFTVETRPDLVTVDTLILLRQLGVTRLQVGIQSLDPHVLQLNNRKITLTQIRNAFALARIFGFKIHAHFMQNLYGSSLAADEAEYLEFMTDPAYQPDEIKLYPCSLVEGTGLHAHFNDASWQPYSEQELIELLAADTLNTPPFVRISRMIRDISSHDIIAGSKRTNLRQLVEKHIEQQPRQPQHAEQKSNAIREIRYREISNREIIIDDLQLDIISYSTTVSTEHFLQWITDDYQIAGFLRLSLPTKEGLAHLADLAKNISEEEPPIKPDEAMIREVHVYGKVAAIDKAGTDKAQSKRSETDESSLLSASEVQRRVLQSKTQHKGLGRQLIEKACDIARSEGYTKVKVISSVGTREYYRRQGFKDQPLYQTKTL